MTPLEFIDTCYQWTSFKEKVAPFLTDKKASHGVNEFVLPRNMTDIEIQRETNSKPIPVEYLASFIQNNCTDKSKWYVIHTKTMNDPVALIVDWGAGDGEWDVDASRFGTDSPWDQGGVFLSPATEQKLETLESDTLTLSSLDARLKKVEQFIKDMRNL